MNWIFQMHITGFAAALFLLLLAQLPEVKSVRWWLSALGAGLGTAALARLTGAAPAAWAAAVLLLGHGAELGCIAGGLLSQHSRRKLARAAFAGSILISALLTLLCWHSVDRFAAASRWIDLTVLVLLAAFLLLHRGQHKWIYATLSAMLLAGVAAELFSIAAALSWVHADSLPAVLAAWKYLGPASIAIALFSIAFSEVAKRHRGFRYDAERFQQLVCSSSQGICEIDSGGRILFVNDKAAEILGIAGQGQAPANTWIQERLRACDDEFSIQSVSEFVFRPGVPVHQAKGRIQRPDQTETFVDWSSSPLVRDGKTVGATVTLHDVTGRETATRLRTELLDLIANNKPVETVSRQLAIAVEEQLPGFCCSVLVCDGESFQVAASRRLPDDLRQRLRGVPCNRILQTVDRRGSRELQNWDDALRSIAREYQIAGMWTEPMVSSANELLGTVLLQHPLRNTLEPWQRRILREAARMGALAIEHHGAYERLLHQGYHDALTGLPNRLLFADRLKQAMARAERGHLQIAYLSIDLDHFKDINDRYGHDAGDLFLRQITARLASQIRGSDTLARMGGDEFALLLSDLHDTHDADRVAHSLLASLEEPFELDNCSVFGAASVGVAFYPDDGRDIETLQRNADRAMYRAKSQGRNLIQFYSGEEPAEERNRVEIEMHLHKAIAEGAFSLQYQPQFSCDRQLGSFEALLRFQHPKLGMVPPSKFIPMAEESGLILSIGEWVLQEACRQILEWQEKGLRPVHVAINVSPMQLASGDFAGAVARTLRTSGISPELLELEITEGVLMSGVSGSSRQIAELARLGVRLAVDDFGTGYSCLSYLHQLPLHTLKIDRSFVAKMLESNGTGCIVETILTLAKKLGLQTVAEGVEEEAQLAQLRAAGCDLIQGYLFSRPLTAIDASRLLFQEGLSEAAPQEEAGAASWMHSVSALPRRFSSTRSRRRAHRSEK